MTLETDSLALDDEERDDIDLPVGLRERRRVAVAQAAAEAASDEGGAAAVRRYGPGCVALALRGPFDRPAREHLQALARELPRAARRELVLDLGGVDRCDASLARTIGRLRIRCLAQGARVELHDPPEALAAELGLSAR